MIKTMRRLLGTLSVVVLLQVLPATAYAQEQRIARVSEEAIQQVVAANLMKNFPDGNFRAERFISRAELAGILVKAFQLDRRVAAQQKDVVAVADVPSSHWAFNDIQTVLKTGIMRGYRGNMFFPNQRVSRAEAFAIFSQAYGVFQFPDNTVDEILAPYPDAATIPSWARRAIATAVNEGFVNVNEQGNLAPLEPITRGDIAYALSKYLQRQQQPPTVENTKK